VVRKLLVAAKNHKFTVHLRGRLHRRDNVQDVCCPGCSCRESYTYSTLRVFLTFWSAFWV